jgi:hypothetical protein
LKINPPAVFDDYIKTSLIGKIKEQGDPQAAAMAAEASASAELPAA